MRELGTLSREEVIETIIQKEELGFQLREELRKIKAEIAELEGKTKEAKEAKENFIRHLEAHRQQGTFEAFKRLLAEKELDNLLMFAIDWGLQNATDFEGNKRNSGSNLTH